MDGIERSGKVNKANGPWSLVATAEFKDLSQFEYPIHTSKRSTKSGLTWSRPGVAHRLGPSEENNSEHLRSNVDETYATVVLTCCLVSLLVVRH
ncbi:unnamed protein product [Dibothriocephalus latus]|uniref:Uncharacterized protein n=1 Tax=Dibothriocephalus latus TaxID=60516 RepID=A0A3P6TQH2_DIBLA|nr:unnamed protein product [Dibothriocephalus latus]